ncbi:MAG: hypothetical protein CVU89_06940 [Firmicutes bacterium HGW-Firmicutes-14]|nr:MAG: hypothetical protein CVU89_06940 [Firmicutes bacterium HGW-Firmicutes-14]
MRIAPAGTTLPAGKVRKTAAFLMIMALASILAFAVTPVLPVSSAWAAEVDQTLQKEIEESLICQDGCGMILSACENQTAEYMRKIIIDRLSKGQSKDEIMGYFVSIYGIKVLAAPPAEGFNITAWVTPFIAITAGGLLVYFVLEKWVFQARLARMDEEEKPVKKHVDYSEYEDRLEDELKKYL